MCAPLYARTHTRTHTVNSLHSSLVYGYLVQVLSHMTPNFSICDPNFMVAKAKSKFLTSEGGTCAPPPAPRNSLCDIELLPYRSVVRLL